MLNCTGSTWPLVFCSLPGGFVQGFSPTAQHKLPACFSRPAAPIPRLTSTGGRPALHDPQWCGCGRLLPTFLSLERH